MKTVKSCYENEDQAEEEPAAVRETEPKPTHNRFTELTPEDRSYYESYIQRPYREPTYSPWEEVQDCTVIAPGIYSVSTAGHGGIMIAAELAPHILSPEAVAEGDRDGWYYCYESLLSDAEYSAAKGSVLNAHYTSKEIIDGIYSALQRFGVKGNNRILEPALGTGNFFGYMPQEIAAGANLYGVELDTVI